MKRSKEAPSRPSKCELGSRLKQSVLSFDWVQVFGDMASSTKVRLNFAPNQNHRDVKPTLLDRMDFDLLLKTASNKLRIKAKRLFTDEGQEITASNLSLFHVRKPCVVLVAAVGSKNWRGIGVTFASAFSAFPASSPFPFHLLTSGCVLCVE